ncbi:PREDICTED: putative carbonic anhydrase 3 [Rhagoletis zephyria]|uniref:putative carbonic anhydrase 3 n=1 Tax=Rhagoletis zephyria TaxID=28612 RepID=UPI0008113EFD|nr:PREDICTED: putative carbonic anhydrase 3 [Rhagoletis zephyria]
MVECSLCSLLSFLFNCIYHVIGCALEYPLVVMALSFLIALVFVTNIFTAKLICDFRSPLRGGVPADGGGSCNESGQGERSASTQFDYGPDNGPHNWRCSDTNQSPINIIDDNVQKFPIRELLCWNHYDDLPNGIMLENNGHTVVLRASYSGNTPTVSGADLLACYTFVELCFRWSSLGNDGSEHMLNYRKFPLELQTGFYSYGGSLTEPPCYQGAEWFLFPEPLAISERQLNEFRQLLSKDGKTRILRNSRPVQDINCTRIVNLNQFNPIDACPMEPPVCVDEESVE